MNWEAIGAIGEIVGAAAVVLTLIYLAGQVKTSNRLSRAEAWRAPNSDLNSINSSFGVDPVFRKAMARFYWEQLGRSHFEMDETMVLDMYLISLTNLYEQLFREVREGILPESALIDFGAQNVISSVYYQESWPAYKANFGPSFAEYFENRFISNTK